jgi:HEPN domain-containing protein
MKRREEVLRELVKQWISKAEFDYEAGRRLVNQAGPLREIVAFHCQQAAERARCVLR